MFRTASTLGVAGLHSTSQQSEHNDIALVPVNKNDLCLSAMQQYTRISPFAQTATLVLQFCSETRSVLHVKCGTGESPLVESCQIIRGTHFQFSAEFRALLHKTAMQDCAVVLGRPLNVQTVLYSVAECYGHPALRCRG